MLLKLLKLNANDAIISGATATSSSGSVTWRKTCHAPPPSTRAASVSSLGIDCSAPSETRKKYGKREPDAHEDHGDARPPGAAEQPGDVRVQEWLTTPKSSFSRPCQTSSDRNAGTA